MSSPLVENIIAAMTAEIQKYGLEVLQRYPRDLLVIDRCMLERYAVPGAHVAWMVGHSHTHIATLGLHPEENLKPTYLTNLANEDRFYAIKISASERITFTEVDRTAFGKLALTSINYSKEGLSSDSFWLTRKCFGRIGTIMIESVGTWQEPKYKATITPVAGCSALDKGALRLWCEQSIVGLAHSLFVRWDIEEAQPIALLAAA